MKYLKVQQVLSVPGQLELFLSPTDCTLMRSVFAGLYSLDISDEGSGGKEGVEAAKQLALSSTSSYVLKPQREGGGNNFYRGFFFA